MDQSNGAGMEISREHFVWLLGSLHGLARLAFDPALILGMIAEVWVGNQDVGFVRPRQGVKLDGENYSVAPGMQVSAEINLGTRSVMEYMLSPVQKAFHEAARER